MQIFIVYAHIYDLIVPVQIIIRFYPSAREETHFEICLTGELQFTNTISSNKQNPFWVLDRISQLED